MEDLKAATKKNEILLKIIILLNLYARIMYYVALLWENVLRE